MQGNEWLTVATSGGGAGFDTQWEPGFVWPIRAALAASDHAARDMNAVANAILHGYSNRALARVTRPSQNLDIDGRSEVMTVTLKDVDNRDRWSVDIEPRPDARPGRLLAQHI